MLAGYSTVHEPAQSQTCRRRVTSSPVRSQANPMFIMALPCQNPAPDPAKPHSDELQLRVDFFRKLGYSPKDVEAALRKVGLDTNAILGELVRIRARAAPCISNSDNDERSTGFKNSLMPLSWTLRPSRSAPEMVQKKNTDEELRPIVIDGSNVAMSHGNKAIFSCRGIELAVNFFLDRGHNNIKVFVPSWRKEQPRPDAPIRDQHILTELENRNIIVFTPSRLVGGKRVVCYDDRYTVKLAAELGGVIVSNDTYRDLQGEDPTWKKCIEERLLMYSFVNDKFMPPDDPLGRHGPTLDNFLRKKPLPIEQKRQPCPYKKKCTYGMKCKYDHPERTNQSYLAVADELREKAQISSNEPSARSSPKSSLHESDSQNFQVSENVLMYRDTYGSSQNHNQVSGEYSQSEWAGQHHVMPSHYYGNVSQDYLDSGLGSYESLTNSHRLWPQQQGQAPAGSRHASMHLEKNNMTQSSQFGPYALPLPTGLQPSRNMEEQPKYNHFAFSCTTPNKSSLPINHQYSAPIPEQTYWSDPYPGMTQARTNLPVAPHPSYSYNSPQYNLWTPQSSIASDPMMEMELRNRLLAIFHPKDIDKAMEMFPHQKHPEKLAAEILKIQAQREMPQ